MKNIAVAFIAALGVYAGWLSVNGILQASGHSRANVSETVVRYEIDARRSKFMVKASRGGLLWFKGHDHHLAVRDFSGHAVLSLDPLESASLELNIRAESLEETSDDFTPEQKAIINKEVKEIVLETVRYPAITFSSKTVKTEIDGDKIRAKVGGYVTLHGVTRYIEIPASITVEGDTLRAVGKFALDRSDFDVKATSAFHGLVRVKNKLKFTFDIVADRAPVSSSNRNET
jgi:polyisoprenoid-binding protein YceI